MGEAKRKLTSLASLPHRDELDWSEVVGGRWIFTGDSDWARAFGLARIKAKGTLIAGSWQQYRWTDPKSYGAREKRYTRILMQLPPPKPGAILELAHNVMV